MKILAEGDVIDVLVDQHEQIKRSLTEVETAVGEAKAVAFLELETLLYVHESGEQQVVHPVTREEAGEAGLADALEREERECDAMLAQLRDLDVSHPDFGRTFTGLRKVVLKHVQEEEDEEFPRLRASQSTEALMALGDQLRAVQEIP